MATANSTPVSPPSALALVVRRLGRFMAIYGSSFAGTLVIGLAITAVLTRALGPAMYGRLGVLLFAASLLTIILNLGSLQGIFRLVYGADADDSGAEGQSPAVASEPRAGYRDALGTGVALTFGLGVVAVAAIAVFREELSQLLLGTREYSVEVVVVASSSVFVSTWRLASNILRYDRRPVAYAVAQVSHSAAVLVAAAILLAVPGRPIRQAAEAYVVGGAVSVIAVLGLVRRDVKVAFSARLVGPIYRLGGSMVGVALSFFLIQSAGVLLLSFYSNPHTVGLFRLAGTLVAPAQYAVSAFLLAWGPLSTAPIWEAMNRELGEENALGGLALYYVIASGLVLVVMSGAAEALTAIAPREYGTAARLVPWLGLVPLARGWLVVVYRVVRTPTARPNFIRSSVFAGIVWLGLTVALVPPLGAYGAAVAPTLALLLASAILLAAERPGAAPAMPWLRIGAAVAIAAAIAVVERLVAKTNAYGLSVAITVAALAAYMLALSGGCVVPGDHRRALVALTRGLIQGRGRSSEVGICELGSDQERVVRTYLSARRRDPIDDPADASLLISALSAVARVDRPDGDEQFALRLARYVQGDLPAAQRQALGRELISGRPRLDPLLLDHLSETAGRLRGRRARRRARP